MLLEKTADFDARCIRIIIFWLDLRRRNAAISKDAKFSLVGVRIAAEIEGEDCEHVNKIVKSELQIGSSTENVLTVVDGNESSVLDDNEFDLLFDQVVLRRDPARSAPSRVVGINKARSSCHGHLGH